MTSPAKRSPTPSGRILQAEAVWFDVEDDDYVRRVQKFMDTYGEEWTDVPNFDHTIMKRGAMKVLSATKELVKYELVITQELCSKTGNLHGGAASLIFDMCTTMAAAPWARKDFWRFGGVSRNLNVTYYRPVPINSVVIVDCWVEQIGKVVATIKGTMKRKGDGVILCAAQHDKVFVDAGARMNKM